MRSFVAIEIDPAVRRKLGGLAPEIQQSGARGRPIPPKSLHLTLKFLGEIDPSRAPETLSTLQEATRSMESFSVETRSLGVFPHLARPRVLWAGISPLETISRLQAEVDACLQGIGFAPGEGDFHPHLTLLRIRTMRDRHGFARWIQRYAGTSFGWTEVRELVLFQSLLKPDGAEYNVVGRVPLGTAPSSSTG